jgi:hypothetical protein
MTNERHPETLARRGRSTLCSHFLPTRLGEDPFFLPVRQSDYRPDCQMGKQQIEIDPPFSDIIKITWEDVPHFP